MTTSERRVRALCTLAEGWEGLADVWLDACEAGEDLSGIVLRDARSMEGALQIADALVGRASNKQVSNLLVHLLADHGIDGRTPLGPAAVIEAYDLVCRFGILHAGRSSAVYIAPCLAIAGSARRTVADQWDTWRAEDALRYACSFLDYQVAAGNADAKEVARVLLAAELDAPPSNSPWIAAMLFRFRSAGAAVPRAMQDLLADPSFDGARELQDSARHRLHAEIAFAASGVDSLLRVLGEWPDAPYGEYLLRLPRAWSPSSRLAVMEAAVHADRVRWAPGWPQHLPHQARIWSLQTLHGKFAGHPALGDLAVGDVVLQLSQRGQRDRARSLLCGHAGRHGGTEHRAEFTRIWDVATLGEGRDVVVTELFGPADPDLDAVLTAVARIPERFFLIRELSVATTGLGAALLTAVLLVDIPSDGWGRQVEAGVFATSFFSIWPAGRDNLAGLAGLPVEEVIAHLNGAVLDDDLAPRGQRIAQRLVAHGKAPNTLVEIDEYDPELLSALLRDAIGPGDPTVELLCLLLGRTTRGIEALLEQFVERATKDHDLPRDAGALLHRAYSAEPRGADFDAYRLAVVLAAVGRLER